MCAITTWLMPSDCTNIQVSFHQERMHLTHGTRQEMLSSSRLGPDTHGLFQSDRQPRIRASGCCRQMDMDQASMSFILVLQVAMDQMKMQDIALEMSPQMVSNLMIFFILNFAFIEASARTFFESSPNKQAEAIDVSPYYSSF